MPHYMVAAVGADRPGVIAALAGALVELECNLSDAQMAVLQGYASMMMLVDAPPGLEGHALQTALAESTEGLGHDVWVRSLSEAPLPVTCGPRWLVSIRGAGRPGVVFEVTRLLADYGVNVVDLQSRRAGPHSSLTMQVQVPVSVEGTEVSDQLDVLGEKLGLSCSMRPAPDQP